MEQQIRLGKLLAIAGLVLGVAILGCSAGDPGATASVLPTTALRPSVSPSSSPIPSATPQPTGPLAFRSERYGYAFELPAGWYLIEETEGLWGPSDLSYIGAGTDSFEEDYEGRGQKSNFPGITYGLYISAAENRNQLDLEAWTKALATTIDDDSSCHGAPERESMTVDGEPAHVLVYGRTDCLHDHHVVVVSVLHGDMGYDMLWLAKRGVDDARRETLESIMRTFEWTK